MSAEIWLVFNILGSLNFFSLTEQTLDRLFEKATELRMVEPRQKLSIATLQDPRLHEIRPLLRLTGDVGMQCMCRHGSLALEFYGGQRRLATLQYVHEKSLRHSSYPGQCRLVDGPGLSRWLLENDIDCSVGEANRNHRDYKLWVRSAPPALRDGIEQWIQPEAFEQAEELLRNSVPDPVERSRLLLAWIGVVEKFGDHAVYLRLATRMLLNIPDEAVVEASQNMADRPELLRGVCRYWQRAGANSDQLPFSTFTALHRAQCYEMRARSEDARVSLPRQWRTLVTEGNFSQLQVDKRGLLAADGQDIVNFCLDSGSRCVIHPGNEVGFQFALGEDEDLIVTQPSGAVFYKSNLPYERNTLYWFGPQRIARKQRHPYGPISTSQFKAWVCQDGTIWRWLKGFDVRLERAKFRLLRAGSALPRLLTGFQDQLIWAEGRRLWRVLSGEPPEQTEVLDFEPAGLALVNGDPAVACPDGWLFYRGRSARTIGRPLLMRADSEGWYLLTGSDGNVWRVEMWPWTGEVSTLASCPVGSGVPGLALSPDCVYLSDGSKIFVHPR